MAARVDQLAFVVAGKYLSVPLLLVLIWDLFKTPAWLITESMHRRGEERGEGYPLIP